MFLDQVRSAVKGLITLDDLEIEISDVIKNAVETNDIYFLKKYFGLDAYKHYATPSQLEKLCKESKDGEESQVLYFYKYLITTYLQLGLLYACKMGNIASVKYYIEECHLPGDLDAKKNEHQKYFENGKSLKGTPLKLAAKNGNLLLVKYLYEQTNAMIETSVEQPLKKTPLMVAAELGHVEVIQYLLEKGANTNSEQYNSFENTPLIMAINSNNVRIVELLVNAGAIVTARSISYAITNNANLNIIQLLLQRSINPEDPYEPYLISAIQSGNVDLLKFFESRHEYNNIDEIATYSLERIEHRMLMAAAKSGNVIMMQYLVEEKKLPIMQIVGGENEELEKFIKDRAENKRNYSKCEMNEKVTSIILYGAVNAYSPKINRVPLLVYLFETLKLQPSNAIIKKICSRVNNLQMLAYLLSTMEIQFTNYKFLHSIAFNLDTLTLNQLFRANNTILIRNGNYLKKGFTMNYLDDIKELIKQKSAGMSKSEIEKLVRNDHEALVGSLFYYCNSEFDKKPDILFHLIKYVYKPMSSFNFGSLDLRNCIGESLALFAFTQRCLHIVKRLLRKGIDPDLPDNQGNTLIFRVLSKVCYNKNVYWIKTYAQDVTESIKYACKVWLGGYDELKELLIFTRGEIGKASVQELVESCLLAHNKVQKITNLFIYLSEVNSIKLARLFRDENFISRNKLSKDDIDYYFTRFNAIDSSVLSQKDKIKRLAKPECAANTESSVFAAQGLFRLKSPEGINVTCKKQLSLST